jgi:hypothetical protein
MRIPAFVAVLLCLSLPAAAQDCWRGEPSPECRSFWVTEFGIFWRLDEISREIRSEEIYDYGIRYEVGPMFNLNGKYALGGTATLTGTGETGLGIHGRLRYWMNRNWSLDLSPGIILHGSSGDDDYELLYPAASTRLVLNYADFVGFYAGVEQIRVRQEGSELDWYFGMHAASYPGTGLGLIFLVLAIVAASSIGVTGTQ